MTAAPAGTPPILARAYATLGPLTAADPTSGWPLLALLAGLTAGDRPLHELAEDPGLDVLLQPENAPAAWLPVVGAVNGALLPPGTSERDQRLEIRTPSGRRRGLPDTVVENVSRTLRDDSTIRFRARTNPDAQGDQRWHALLQVRRSDLRPELTTGSPEASNLVTNPALATDTAGWTAQNATIARSTGGSASGPQSLRVQSGSQQDPQAWTPIGARAPGTPMQAGARALLPSSETSPSVVRLALEIGGLYPATIAEVNVELRPGIEQTITVGGIVPNSHAWNELGQDYPTWSDVGEDYATWQELMDGHPTWADAADVGARVVLGGPRNPATGAPQAGRAVYWGDPHANVGTKLDPYGHGSIPGWAWTGETNASPSARPDTRDSPALRRALALALPAGVVGHLRWITTYTDWSALAARYPTWAAVVSAFPTWQALLNAAPED